MNTYIQTDRQTAMPSHLTFIFPKEGNFAKNLIGGFLGIVCEEANMKKLTGV
jgi:hypothetical protein